MLYREYLDIIDLKFCCVELFVFVVIDLVTTVDFGTLGSGREGLL